MGNSFDLRKMLREQFQLLSEHSKKTESAQDLCSLTHAMKVLYNDVRRKPIVDGEPTAPAQRIPPLSDSDIETLATDLARSIHDSNPTEP